jgi:probable HAF family extracellular repeat protein
MASCTAGAPTRQSIPQIATAPTL